MKLLQNEHYTVLTDQDLHDSGFRICHFRAHPCLSLQIPLNTRNMRTIHLGPAQCRDLAFHLLRFAQTGELSEPQTVNDFQI